VTRSDVLKLDWRDTHVPGIHDAGVNDQGWAYVLRGSNVSGPDAWASYQQWEFGRDTTSFVHEGLVAYDTWHYQLLLVPKSVPDTTSGFVGRHSSEVRLNLTVGSPPARCTNLNVNYSDTLSGAAPRISFTFDPPTAMSDLAGTSLSSYPVHHYRVAIRDVMNATSTPSGDNSEDTEVFVPNGQSSVALTQNEYPALAA
jgi:hypothetical protein